MLEHGGNLRQAAQAFNRPLADWIDLSTGINPHGYPAPALDPQAYHRLPETDPALALAAAAYYHAPLMLAVAGTQAAIQALPRLRSPSRVVVAAPSYAEHAQHWALHGHSMRQVPYAELDAALDQCDVMVVCNPNNPTGATLDAAVLIDWAARLAARGGWLLVDEAFGDTVPQLSVAAHSGQPGLIVLCSVGKFFGLAGLRLGFVAAHPTLLAALADLLGPWGVSGPAQTIAYAALTDLGWQSAMRTQLVASGKRLQSLLAHHHIEANGCALFQWWPEARATAFWQHMAERGIWVRLFRAAAGGIRLGLPPDETSWRRLAQALEEWNANA
ncbi:threonine-phosphate decarboxylase CobD [Massilia psychrophila]|jgi:cobalamin biosynthetic protein CobC|uniref:threonine-phosphate decarboxylase n=1 Tax=Massilia psychrophila TaxID=1603353 RepID=A0A2G8T5Q9_9BURK|nr:threonine-phosphate decarboxylase CobD [Massilia psychrophila]PIL41354.1 threonine-phosphate decarboxylase [Massilia psychrophila]GGE65343.1 threonine-phosphate decarboxylase [Massilia psychrophila]